MEARTRVSQSYLRTWMTCPLQAKFHYIDKLPDQQNAKASFGSCIHHALEHYNRNGNVEMAVALFRDVWANPEKLGVTPDVWPKFTSYGGLMEKGESILRDYDEKNRWETRRILGIEHRFLVPFGQFTLDGIVDVLELKKSARGVETLRIVDYKTNAKAPNRTMLGLDVQWTAYDFASRQPEFWMGNGPTYPALPDGERLYEELFTAPRRNIWYGLYQQKEYDAGERDDDDYLRLHRCCVEIRRAIEAEVFVPNISGESCTFCPYHKPCGLPLIDVDREDSVSWF